MREKTHKKITETVLDLLGANDIKDKILDAIMIPDIKAQYNMGLYINHCYIRNVFGDGINAVKRAYNWSIESGKVEFFAYALHYAQDLCVPAHCSNTFTITEHKQMEAEMDEIIDEVQWELTEFPDLSISKILNDIITFGEVHAIQYKKDNKYALRMSIVLGYNITYWLVNKYLSERNN